MNITDNKFVLTNIEKNENGISIYIDIESDDGTKEIYLNNYFEGLYIGTSREKYNIYTEIKDNRIIGEILFDTIEGLAINKSQNILRLWARNRIGNTYVDNAVYIGIEETKLYYGHKKQFMFVVNDDTNFYFTPYKNGVSQNNPLKYPRDIRDIRDVRVCIEGEALNINANVSSRLLSVFEEEGINNELVFAWKDVNTKKLYYFHEQEIIGGNIEFILSKNEINQMNVLETDWMQFDWLMIDAKEREYKLYVDENIKLDTLLLPTSDYYAELIVAEDYHLTMRMNNTLFFEYSNLCYQGNGFILDYKKRSYDLEIINVIAQRVNTELEYELPFEIMEEDDEYIRYDVRLKFDIHENDFKNGIYQIWIVIKDGISTDRYHLKLFRNIPIKENTYLVNQQPYAVVDKHCYNCLFYNDNSNNLKINIIPKLMKLQIKEAQIKGERLKFSFALKKEPYFEKVSSVVLLAENEDLIEVEYKVIEGVKENELVVETAIPVDILNIYGCNASFIPQIRFGGKSAFVKIENNYFRPSINNREVGGFSFLINISEESIRRVWGDYLNGTYRIGITENINLLKEIGMWLYEEDKLCIRLDWILEEEDNNDANLNLYIRDKITGKEHKFDRELAVEDEIIFRIPLENIENREYLLTAKLSENTLSYLEMTSKPFTLFSNKTSKKVTLKKNDDKSLSISVEEMLLYENVDKVEECNAIIERARKENERKNRKVWLVGENYGLSARDNGLAFFEFCMQNNVDAEVYFVYKAENEEAGVLKTYKDNVVLYDSMQHIYLDEIAEFYVVSHGIRDVMPSLYHDSIGKYRKNVIYLQHGITAMKINGINNKSYGGSIRKFVVASEQEKELLIGNGQFWEDELIVTGFARYDKLDRTNVKKQSNYIWIMPTWRDWLVKSEKDFLNSEFYSYYSQILSDETLIKKLRKSGIQIVFSLHIEFEKYKEYFDKLENDVVHITDMHEKCISDRVKECNMIITDYSSIIFDVVYLDKPAIFFQYDQDMYNKYRGSYVDLETELPGEVTHNPEELINAIKRMIDANFVVNEDYIIKSKRYFDFYDSNNSQRIYEEILKCREEIADEY